LNIKCDRCGKKSDNLVEIRPIDEDGHNLGFVGLCWKCREDWGEVFVKKVKGKPNWLKAWSVAWKKFMRKTLKEEVQFT
jgi:hypothetical protein